MANTKFIKYKEGSWFTVPLDSGEFAIGLVARKSPGGGVILAYFFNKTPLIPDLSKLGKYEPVDSTTIAMVGDLGLTKGEWEVIGELPGWDRSQWKIPNFVRREEITGRVWLVQYSDDNPNHVLSEEQVTENFVKNLEPDLLWGYKSAEKRLSKLLE